MLNNHGTRNVQNAAIGDCIFKNAYKRVTKVKATDSFERIFYASVFIHPQSEFDWTNRAFRIQYIINCDIESLWYALVDANAFAFLSRFRSLPDAHSSGITAFSVEKIYPTGHTKRWAPTKSTAPGSKIEQFFL